MIAANTDEILEIAVLKIKNELRITFRFLYNNRLKLNVSKPKGIIIT